MTVYDEILQWSMSSACHRWQADALRRIVTSAGPELAKADIDELTRLCLGEDGYNDGDSPLIYAPLSPDDIPASAPHGVIALTSLGPVVGVSAIAGDVCLPFNPSGLTVVFGENGSGKSSYVRILKSACRAREVGKIHPDVRNPVSSTHAQAELTYDSDGGNIPVRWRMGEPSPDDLSHICVFDSTCAAVHVDKDNDVAFEPLGLDVITKLSETCDAISEELERRRSGLTATVLPVPDEYSLTQVSAFIANMRANTSSSQVVEMATFSESDATALISAERRLAEVDPAKRASELAIVAKSMAGMATRLESASLATSAAAESDLVTALKALEAARSEATLVSEGRFAGASLAGIGTELWKRLWESARAFSTAECYQGHAFPHTMEGARCVLCHQVLDSDAKRRLEGFEEFVKAHMEERVTESRARVELITKGFKAIAIEFPDDTSVFENISLEDVGLSDRLRNLVTLIANRRTSLGNAIASSDTLEPAPRVDADVRALRVLSEAMTRRSEALRQSSDPDEIEKLTTQVREGRARRWFAANRAAGLKERNRIIELSAVVSAIGRCRTTSVTYLGKRLTKQYVTDELQKGFLAELKLLDRRFMAANLVAAKARKGKTYHRIALDDCKRDDVHLHEIVSEGEHGVLALSAFLAEIAQDTPACGIVLDDPVSSLDHRWRAAAAERLVAIAKQRQVIVLTHDLFFLTRLLESAVTNSILPLAYAVYRTPETAGLMDAHVPWSAEKVRARLKRLLVEVGKAQKCIEASD